MELLKPRNQYCCITLSWPLKFIWILPALHAFCVWVFVCVHVNACMLSRLSCVQLYVTPWTIARQAPLSLGFSRQEYWSGVPFPSPGDLPDPGMESTSPAVPVWQADSLSLSHQGSHANSSTKFNIYRFIEPPAQLRNRNSPSPRKLPSVTFYGLPSRQLWLLFSITIILLGNHWQEPPALARHHSNHLHELSQTGGPGKDVELTSQPENSGKDKRKEKALIHASYQLPEFILSEWCVCQKEGPRVRMTG